MRWIGNPLSASGVVAAACLLLAGCQGEISVDMTTEPPASANVTQVVVSLSGLEFQKGDGGTERIEYGASEPVDLVELTSGDLLTLFTDERLPEGTYTGVRLLFDNDVSMHYVMDNIGRRFPMTLIPGNYAPIDVVVESDRTRREALTLTLDIRQSLSFDDGNEEYRLEPVLRSVPAAEASIITGVVDIACPSGTSLLTGGAVYLFQGRDVVPDDRDGIGVEPYATASLDTDLGVSEFTYAILDLPAGDYTIAATCRGDEEDPTVDNDLGFVGAQNVELEAETVLTVDIVD